MFYLFKGDYSNYRGCAKLGRGPTFMQATLKTEYTGAHRSMYNPSPAALEFSRWQPKPHLYLEGWWT